MKNLLSSLLYLLCLTPVLCHGQLQVSATLQQPDRNADAEPASSRVAIRVKNAFKQPVKNARAWVFLLDAAGKVVGQKAAWLKAGDESAASANEATEGSGFASSSQIPNVRSNPSQDLKANPTPAATATSTATATDPIQALTTSDQPPLLDAAAENTFRIAVAHERPKEQNPVGTPASVRLVFSRIILADGRSVNPQTGVEELRP